MGMTPLNFGWMSVRSKGLGRKIYLKKCETRDPKIVTKRN
jgi:hypothetical protein